MSVVLAVHNGARWIGEAIASVRQQRFPDWDLVVVDDGSTDGTREAVAAHLDDRRIRLVVQDRRERAAARNRGIAESGAPLVAFLDADDLWQPEKLARQVAALGANPDAGLCYTIARFIDQAGRRLPLRKPRRVVGGDLLGRLLHGNLMILASVVARRDCLVEVGGFDETLPIFGCEDWDLWLRIARRHPVVALDEELTLYRRHPGNTSAAQVLASALAVVDRFFADPARAPHLRLSRTGTRARLYWYDAAALARTDRRAAVRLARQALTEAPRALVTRPAIGALVALTLPPRLEGALRRWLP